MSGVMIFNIVLGILALSIGTLALIRGSHLTALGMGFVLLSNFIQIIQGYINNKKSKAE